ncbi:hypothetical protein JNUCC1_03307 [Lentibacillus sp. JNUCC-1]|uniref:hypothetical protein n=1 Tax=Lentibacillus sp. JNUCC-1 TaxID=2654513 RepID=UPI0012E746BD|nr:hypothetical protein [Lentibacillus sp. JNUCC-1]MUV39429.1 hypothetical protein [Lentibacillus sp. JNUCC-1]
MKERQPIDLYINGQHSDGDSQLSRTIEAPSEEQAAALESATEGELPVYKRTYNPQDTNPKKTLFQNINVKSVLIAVGSAVVIGLCLGFFMLVVMGGFSDDQAGGVSPSTNNANPGSADAGGANDSDKPGTTAFALEPMGAVVLQAGVFTEADNAATIAEQFQRSGIATVKWNKNDQVYLFAGIAQTEEAASALVSEIAPLEVYVKNWETEEGRVDTDSQTKEWLGNLQQKWRESLEHSSKGERINGQEWTSIGKSYPKQDERFDKLHEAVLQSERLNDSASLHQQQAFLIEVWKQLNAAMLQ